MIYTEDNNNALELLNAENGVFHDYNLTIDIINDYLKDPTRILLLEEISRFIKSKYFVDISIFPPIFYEHLKIEIKNKTSPQVFQRVVEIVANLLYFFDEKETDMYFEKEFILYLLSDINTYDVKCVKIVLYIFYNYYNISENTKYLLLNNNYLGVLVDILKLMNRETIPISMKSILHLFSINDKDMLVKIIMNSSCDLICRLRFYLRYVSSDVRSDVVDIFIHLFDYDEIFYLSCKLEVLLELRNIIIESPANYSKHYFRLINFVIKRRRITDFFSTELFISKTSSIISDSMTSHEIGIIYDTYCLLFPEINTYIINTNVHRITLDLIDKMPTATKISAIKFIFTLMNYESVRKDVLNKTNILNIITDVFDTLELELKHTILSVLIDIIKSDPGWKSVYIEYFIFSYFEAILPTFDDTLNMYIINLLSYSK